MGKEIIKPLYILISLLFTVALVQAYVIYDLKQEECDTKEKVSQASRPVPQAQRSVDPFIQMQKIQEHMMKEFGNFNAIFANDPFFQESFIDTRFSPMSDIIEEEKAYILEINIPGVDEQKIAISNDENILHVSANSQKRSEANSTNYIYKESFGHYFKRSFTLPEDADLSRMKNSYHNGILKITIQKKSR